MLTTIGRTGPESLKSLDGMIKTNEGRADLPNQTIVSVATQAGVALPENAAAISIQVSGTYAGVVFAVDFSDDNVNYEQGVRGFANASNVGAASFTPGTNATKRYVFPVNGAKYFRVRSTGWTSGTANLLIQALPRVTLALDVPATQVVSLLPLTTSGLLRHRLISAASTNSTLVATGAKKLYAIHAFNLAATDSFLKVYNKATAPTVGTDVPVLTLVLPGKPAGGATQMMRFDLADFGDAFALGIGIGITGAVGDTDTTAVTAASNVVNTHYL